MFVACLVFQGTNASALEKDIGPEQFPINEHYFGLVNVSPAASSHALTAFIDRTTKQWWHLSQQTSPGVSGGCFDIYVSTPGAFNRTRFKTSVCFCPPVWKHLLL